MKDIIDTIDNCLAQERLLPALVLLYAAIDAIASFEREPGEGTRAAFTRWAEQYLLRPPSLRCTALELYGARCGILHTFTPASDLSGDAKARMVVYAYGGADESNPAVCDAMARKDCVVVHVGEFVTSFQAGLANYLEQMIADPEREKRLATAIEMWFAKVPN